MAWSKNDLVQRGHYFAIVDEVDSILIDEARTPLIISGPADQSSKWYSEFARLVPRLHRDVDYEVDESKRTVGVTEEGVAKVEQALGIENLYESVNTPLVGFLNNALKAKELYKKDRDYIVVSGEVLIVDEFTGRVLHGRRYNEGMHQAIEAKEGVEIKAENQTLATITLQNYFRLYEKLAGMTGTAQTEAAELHQTYKLGVVPIPPNKPIQRARRGRPDLQDRGRQVRRGRGGHRRAARERPAGAGRHRVGGEVRTAEQAAAAGRRPARGAERQEPRPGGGDHRAGRPVRRGHRGHQHGRSRHRHHPGRQCRLQRRPRAAGPGPEPDRDAGGVRGGWPDAVEEATKRTKAEAEKVREAGGLYVLGTERHESRRIDNQLRGRSGRQGDPGESRFYLSLGDELMRRVGGGTVEMLMTRLRMPDDVPIEHNFVSKAIKSAQTQVEQQNFEIRKNVLKYDEVMNKQRTVIYDERRRVLDGEDLHLQVQNMITDVITAYVDGATAQGYAEDWDTDTLWTALKTLYPISVTPESIAKEHGDLTRPSLQGGRAGRRPGGLGQARGDADPADHPRAGAPGGAVRAGPQVARAPLRDGLPQGGHRTAGDGAARSAGRVPARGLRHVRRDARLAQGGVRRIPVQPAGPGGARRRAAGRRSGRAGGHRDLGGGHRARGGRRGGGQRLEQRPPARPFRQRRRRTATASPRSRGAGCVRSRPCRPTRRPRASSAAAACAARVWAARRPPPR